MRVHSLLVALALCLAAATVAQASVETGTLSSDDGFAFASKFCYQTGSPAGTVSITLKMPTYIKTSNGSLVDQTDVQFVWFDDQDASTPYGSWDKLLDHWDSWSCAEKVANSKAASGRSYTTRALSNNGQTATLTFSPETYTQESRPRYWFFTFARCNDLGFEDVEYHIHTLESGESRWNEEFGANDLGLNSLYLCFFFVFTIMVGLNCRGAYKLQMRLSYLHPIVKWFLVIVVIEYISVFMMLIHYGSYSSNGVGVPTLLRVAQVLAIVSRCFFLFLLALLAKGYTISRDTVTYRWAVVGVILAWLGLSIFIFIWQQTLVDPKLTSPTSKVEAMTIVLNVIWLTFAAWFIAQVIASYRSETSQVKRSMYLKIGIAFAPWFIAPPLVSLAVFALDPWVRDRIVAMLTITVTTVAYIVLSFLFWPTRAEEYFSISTPRVDADDLDYAPL